MVPHDMLQLAHTLEVTSRLLGQSWADYCFEGRFRFTLDAEWSLVLSADDAGRIRLEACLRSRVRRTLWCLADDDARLEALVLGAREEVAALV